MINMKKALSFLTIAIVSFSLFASFHFHPSMGLRFFDGTERIGHDGTTQSTFLEKDELSLGFDAVLTGKRDKSGLSVGITCFFPVSEARDGITGKVSFFDISTSLRIGYARNFNITEWLALSTGIGYEMKHQRALVTTSGEDETPTLVTHALYLQGRLYIEVKDKVGINLGLTMTFPSFGGGVSKGEEDNGDRYSISYSGVALNPFIGFVIR